MQPPSARQVRIAAAFAIVPMVVAAGVVLTNPDAMAIMSRGPLQVGHEAVNCESCHAASPGTIRQQVQAKVHFAVGMRQTPADFGYGAVTSKACLACHERPNERHPIFRFREPRFQGAVNQIEATSCLGCHSEHTTHRATTDLVFCQACHEDLRLTSDPLDISHDALIGEGAWQSCLGCHDFHGNHPHKAPVLLDAAVPAEVVAAYLRDGPSPYALPKLYEAEEDGR